VWWHAPTIHTPDGEGAQQPAHRHSPSAAPLVERVTHHYVRGLASGLGSKLCLATLAAIEAEAGIEVPARKS
jgi:hypothetical protein